jgi:hypothetical protein
MGPGLEQLRETFHVSPRASLWTAVTEWFDRYGHGPDAGIATTYARTHLAGLTRPAPPAWVSSLLQGGRPPGWELANHVCLRGNRLAPDQLSRLLERGALTGVESLDMGDTGLGQDGLQLLCGPRGPQTLNWLDMGNSRRSSLELTDATPLLDARFARQLQGLHLANNRLTPACVSGLRRGGLRLRSLNLSGNGLGPEGITALADAEFLARMDTLTLSNTAAGDEAVRDLLGARSVFTTLKVSTNGLTDAAFQDRELDVRNVAAGDNPLGVEGLQALLGALSGAPVRVSLWACRLSAPALAVLATSEVFATVERLELGWNRLDAGGAAALATGHVPARLRALDLRGSKLGDDGVAVLAGMEMPQLRTLSLRRCHLTGENSWFTSRRWHTTPFGSHACVVVTHTSWRISSPCRTAGSSSSPTCSSCRSSAPREWCSSTVPCACALTARRSEMDETTSVRLIEALAAIWTKIRTLHPDVPGVVLLPAPALQRNVLGHFAPLRWRPNTEGDVGFFHEVVVVAEHMNREPNDILETLIHEAAHAQNFNRGIKDCSKNQYHNRKFKVAAEELGLVVHQVKHYGFAYTELADGTADRYRAEVHHLTDVLVHRRSSWAPTPTPTSNTDSGVATPTGTAGPSGPPRHRRMRVICSCGFIIYASRKTLRETRIRCESCGNLFALPA